MTTDKAIDPDWPTLFGLTTQTRLIRMDDAGRERGTFGIVEAVGKDTWDEPTPEARAAMNRREAFWSSQTKPIWLAKKVALRDGGVFAHTNPGFGTDGDLVHWSGGRKTLVSAGRFRAYKGVLVADCFHSMSYTIKSFPDFQRDLKQRTEQLSDLLGEQILVEHFGNQLFDYSVFIHLHKPVQMAIAKIVFERAQRWFAPLPIQKRP